MQKLEDAIVLFLETFAQPQRWPVIDDFLYESGYRDYSEDDARALVKSGDLILVEDGVDAGGNVMEHYAPKNYDPTAESPNATARLRY